MPIQMTREEMIDDLELTWRGIQDLDPESPIDLIEARSVWESQPDDRLEISYNQAREHLWRLLKNH